MEINKQYSLTIFDELDLVHQNVVFTHEVASEGKTILLFKTII